MALRRALLGDNLCDLCRTRQGTEYHEVIPRAQTIARDDLRRLSFEPEICALLCHECHQKIAPTAAGIQRILEHLISLYGRERVEEALEKIPLRFRRGVQIR